MGQKLIGDTARQTPLRLTQIAIVCTLTIMPVAAHAGVDISTKATQNMSCANGVCAPTAKKAVLNVNDLTTMLAAGDLKVTTGAGALDIHVLAPFSWTSISRLTLQANRIVTIEAAIAVAGTGGLTLERAPNLTNGSGSAATANSGLLIFRSGGKINFWDLNSSLVISGKNYLLVSSITQLRDAVEAYPNGYIAFAADYDATNDGTYKKPPVRRFYSSTLEGLGNTISNFSVTSDDGSVGLIGSTLVATIRDLTLSNVNVIGRGGIKSKAGGLVGENDGEIDNCYTSGTVTSSNGAAGGVAGYSGGSVSDSHSTAAVSGITYVGGLVGKTQYQATIVNSSATGNVSAASMGPAEAGGLVGFLDGSQGYAFVQQSYATGSASGTNAGGLVGASSQATIRDSYSTGSATGYNAGGLAGNADQYVYTSYSTGFVNGAGFAGGLVGYGLYVNLYSCYWDLDTSGISDPSQGVGTSPNYPGVTGLTDAQLKSALPAGFDPNIWGQDPNINNGYPYLLANPPPGGNKAAAKSKR